MAREMETISRSSTSLQSLSCDGLVLLVDLVPFSEQRRVKGGPVTFPQKQGEVTVEALKNRDSGT